VMHEPARPFDIIQDAIRDALYLSSIRHPDSPTPANLANVGRC
jgi:hypothetical protein